MVATPPSRTNHAGHSSEQGFTLLELMIVMTIIGLLAAIAIPSYVNNVRHAKEAVLMEIIESAVDRFVDAAQSIERMGLPAPLALRELIRAHLDIVADNPERTRIVFHQWRCLSDENRHLLLPKRAHYAEYFTKLVEAGMKSGDFSPHLNLKVTVLTILGALNWTPEWFSPSGRASADEIADQMADSLLGGLAA